jgi:transposase-like protein
MTQTEKKILKYLEDGKTVKQIAAKHDCSTAFVRKVRIKLRNAGLISKVTESVTKTGGESVTPVTKNVTKPDDSVQCRLHAQKFRIELIKPIDERYKKNINKIFQIDGHDIQCFSDTVCIQAREHFDFYGKTEDEAIALSLEYWDSLFLKLENRIETMILKDQKMNITQTYAEWATTPCELAKECAKRDYEIRIYAKDGKLRYTTDKSLKFEREAHHHITGKKDSETGNRFLNDVLDHPEVPVYSEMINLLGSTLETLRAQGKQNELTATALHGITEYLKNQLPQKEPEEPKIKPERARYIG